MDKGKAVLSGTLLGIVAVGQIFLAFFFYDPHGIELVINLGWGVMMLSAVFGWLPIYTFRKKGKVEGRGYIHTTVLVESGIYGIVRPPQYLAGVLMSLALPMISQHWSVAATGLIAAVTYYLDTYAEEERCIEKFGEAYSMYRKKVPRMNFMAGIVRAIRRGLGSR